MAESEPGSRVIEEINLAEDDEVECIEDCIALDVTEDNEMVVDDEEEENHENDEPDQDIVDITPPPEV